MGNPTDPTQMLMQQAQTSLQNPLAQPVPQPQGGIDQGVHPVIAAIIKALSGGAQSYGWTGIPPEQRIQRQHMEQQKAETMARMAQTGAYQEGELGIRRDLATTAGRNADTKAGELSRKQSWDEFKQSMQKQQEEDKVEHNKAIEALAQGRIDEASRHNDTYLQSVKNHYQAAEQNVGLGYGKLAVQQDLANILRYRSQLEATTVQQRGTENGVKAQLELSKMESDHWLQGLLGSGGMPSAQQSVQQALPMPGAAQPNPSQGIPGVSPGGAPATGSPPTTSLPAPPATNKIQAKKNQQSPQPVMTFGRKPDGSIGPQ